METQSDPEPLVFQPVGSTRLATHPLGITILAIIQPLGRNLFILHPAGRTSFPFQSSGFTLQPLGSSSLAHQLRQIWTHSREVLHILPGRIFTSFFLSSLTEILFFSDWTGHTWQQVDGLDIWAAVSRPVVPRTDRRESKRS